MSPVKCSEVSCSSVGPNTASSVRSILYPVLPGEDTLDDAAAQRLESYLTELFEVEPMGVSRLEEGTKIYVNEEEGPGEGFRLFSTPLSRINLNPQEILPERLPHEYEIDSDLEAERRRCFRDVIISPEQIRKESHVSRDAWSTRVITIPCQPETSTNHKPGRRRKSQKRRRIDAKIRAGLLAERTVETVQYSSWPRTFGGRQAQRSRKADQLHHRARVFTPGSRGEQPRGSRR
ncbi:uncharacterized protein SPPG_03196 [Spizellomyces punctatus DAOM BR117]|uniref:Uncharacterized protein n=1 Tax=Spizellomyces punctatus (strain DAOM BR117) TaxID=645134 RepID=A0A0L0HKM2_SPIPD|nr:uncharacterized protein SPPG_03196 [Spizellomyces punctatus DAOM BR117]KND01384.1 hypothetical protein SPPG_03196 [Spizellomyces punctatus DAOM BR117]|eukprot:XP_016609423.1 hypothetical protein SPPG_03196 [Spizellomyces punctatus DAOM BR117]